MNYEEEDGNDVEIVIVIDNSSLTNPEHLQDGLGARYPIPEVIAWLNENVGARHYEMFKSQLGCEIYFENTTDMALYKLTWWSPPKDDV